MKLSQLAAKPQLIEVKLDEQEVIDEFGEPLEFYTWDRQPLDVFMKLASANQADFPGMVDIVRTLILDEKGEMIIKEGAVLPSKVMIAAVAKIVDCLGK